MSAIDLLREILHDNAVIPFSRDGKSVDLRENETAFTIRGLPEDSIAMKADKFPAPENFFWGTSGENKRADFIIISETPTKKWIIYIEMKGEGRDCNSEIIKQLKGAQCVIAYCRSVAERFHGKVKFLDEKQYQSRFISVKSVSVSKKPFKNPRDRVHDSPEKMLKLKHIRRFQFSQLVGNQ